MRKSSSSPSSRFAQQLRNPPPPSSPIPTRPRLLHIVPADLAPQDVPTEQLMQIRKQIAEEAQYFNESFQQLRMAQS
jgi:hypothetical protein